MAYQRNFHYNQEIQNSHSSSSSYSEDSDDSDSNSHSLSSLSKNSSPELQKSRNNSSRLRNSERTKFSTSPNIKLQQTRSKREKNHQTSKNTSQNVNNESASGNLFIVMSLVTIVCLCFIIPQIQQVFAGNNKPLDRDKILKNVEDEIRLLKKEFRNQEKKIWPEIYSGIIEVINNPTRPSIFILFADRSDLMSCLALTIGELGRMAFGTKESLTVKPTQLDNDTGDVINKLRSIIPQRKSVVSIFLFSE